MGFQAITWKFFYFLLLYYLTLVSSNSSFWFALLIAGLVDCCSQLDWPVGTMKQLSMLNSCGSGLCCAMQSMYTCFGQFLTYLTPSDLLAQLLAALFSQLWSYFK